MPLLDSPSRSTAPENIRKPVITAHHLYCVGGEGIASFAPQFTHLTLHSRQVGPGSEEVRFH